MNTATIPHPALVALQGRLRTVQVQVQAALGKHGEDTKQLIAIQLETEYGIRQIDDWLMQPPEEGQRS